MIVDCHTHLWTRTDQLGQDAREYLRRQGVSDDITAGPAAHRESSAPVDKTLVMGYRSSILGANVSNEFIAEYVAGDYESLIGIAAIDPTDEDALDEAQALLAQDEFRGITVSPSAQNFHPADSRAMKLYALADERRVPVFFQQGTHFPARGSMEYARPLLLDEIAREFPDLTMVVSALGHPWVEEGIALVGKHGHVFADIAALIRRPWQAYNALVLAHQFNVMDKILFGSDFPFSTASEAIKSLYRLHEFTQGTNLPSVPRETLRSVVERNALEDLRIARADEAVPEDSEEDLLAE